MSTWSWTSQGSGTPGSVNTSGVFMSSNGTFRAICVYNGYIYTSTNGGTSWTARATDTARTWYGIAGSSDGVKLVACTQFSGIFTSTDSGVTWTQQAGASTRSYRGIASSANGSIIVACVNGSYIYTSTDSGVTWTERQVSGTTRSWISVAISDSGTTMIAVPNAPSGGNVYVSTDTGVNWTARASNDVYRSCAMSPDGTIMIATPDNSKALRSTNSGTTWSAMAAAPTISNTYASAVSSDGRIIAVAADGGLIHVSSNYGTSFVSQSTPGSQAWRALAYRQVNANNILFAGPSNALLYSGVLTDIVCFREGSKICVLNPMTGAEEHVPVERLRPGTLVKTHMSGYVPVCMVGTSTMTIPVGRERTSERLYVCSKAQFPELTEDLYITGRHSILVDSLTGAEREACAADLGRVYVTEGKYRLPAHIDRRAQVYEAPGAVERIWHFALENNDEQMNYGVYANGLLVESCSIWRLRTMVGYTILDSRSQVYIVGDEDSGAGAGAGRLLENTVASATAPIVC